MKERWLRGRAINLDMLALCEAHMSSDSLEEKAWLSTAGDIASELLYVDSGLLRVCVTRYDGKEFNKTFVAEGMFFADLYSYWLAQPSVLAIQALEPCHFRRMPLDVWQRISLDSPQLQQLLLSYMQERYLRHEHRELSLQTQDGTERYLDFCKFYPGLDERLPAYHVASYLGMSEVSLSRIKKSIKAAS